MPTASLTPEASMNLPSAEAQQPNTEIVQTHSQAIRDVSGITGVGQAADTARLISQFGIPSVVLGVFIIVFLAVLWFFRVDWIAQDTARTNAHERTIKTIVDANTTLSNERREDDKERERNNRDSNSKIWQSLREVVVATQDGNKTLEKATAIMTTNHELLAQHLSELRKLNKSKE